MANKTWAPVGVTQFHTIALGVLQTGDTITVGGTGIIGGPGAVASGAFTMIAQPDEGDTVDDGDTGIVFAAEPLEDYECEIGATLAASAANLLAKLQAFWSAGPYPVDVAMVDNDNGTFTFNVTATEAGERWNVLACIENVAGTHFTNVSGMTGGAEPGEFEDLAGLKDSIDALLLDLTATVDGAVLNVEGTVRGVAGAVTIETLCPRITITEIRAAADGQADPAAATDWQLDDGSPASEVPGEDDQAIITGTAPSGDAVSIDLVTPGVLAAPVVIEATAAGSLASWTFNGRVENHSNAVTMADLAANDEVRLHAVPIGLSGLSGTGQWFCHVSGCVFDTGGAVAVHSLAGGTEVGTLGEFTLTDTVYAYAGSTDVGTAACGRTPQLMTREATITTFGLAVAAAPLVSRGQPQLLP